MTKTLASFSQRSGDLTFIIDLDTTLTTCIPNFKCITLYSSSINSALTNKQTNKQIIEFEIRDYFSIGEISLMDNLNFPQGKIPCLSTTAMREEI